MKTTMMHCFLFLFSLLFLLGCSKDDDNVREFGTMEARINGELVIFANASGYGFFDLENSCSKNFHQVIGGMEFRASDGHTIYLNFRPSQGIGTYKSNGQYHTWVGEYSDFGTNGIFYSQNYFVGETQTHHEEIGFVTVTSVENNRYKGTFYFTAVYNGEDYYDLPEVVNITEGKFDILAEFHVDYGATPCGYD
ncbi:MAG: hypothetical protein V7719_16935 [Psychroserpens sp.]|uniref:hypothetical protein n=1 Tax=Psychroserpens sp. TaxID=2020870 RepID=UPI0030013DE3